MSRRHLVVYPSRFTAGRSVVAAENSGSKAGCSRYSLSVYGPRVVAIVAVLGVLAAWPHAQNLQKVTINYPTRSGASWPLYIAKEGGYYAKQGFMHVDVGKPRFWEATTSRTDEDLSGGNARVFALAQTTAAR